MIHETIEAPAAEAATVAFTIDRDELHEALALLCKVVERRNTADPAAVIAQLQPKPTVELTMAVEAVAAIAMALSGWHAETDEPSAAIIPFPAGLRAAQIAAEQPAATETEIPADLSTDPPSAETVRCWIHPDKIKKSWARRNDPTLTQDWRDYHRGVVRMGVRILKERRDEKIGPPVLPPEAPVEPREEETAVPQPAAPEIAPEAAQGADTGGFEGAGEVIGALFAEMRARIEALEAAVNSSGTQPEVNSGAAPAAQLSDSNNFTRERRLRIVRAYLRLRRQRDGARHATELAHDMNRNNLLAGRAASDRADRERHKRRAAIRHALRLRTLSRENAKANARAVSEERRAEDAEFNAADLEKRLEEAQAQLAAETARADSADARWNVVLDDKQARLVALQNEVIELRSGGRIKLTPPLRANAQPVWASSVHGRA